MSKPQTLPMFNIPQFPKTRYQGSKAKLIGWIWDQIKYLDFHTCLDAFGGTGVVGWHLKQKGKSVTYNDLLRFNYHIGHALIENADIRLTNADVDLLTQQQPKLTYPTFIQDTFQDIYFTDAENAWLDRTLTHLQQLGNPYKFSLAFFALAQACIIKRPYNLFHRKNLYVRTADVERSFGNKTTWDKPFEDWFKVFVDEGNAAVFDNGETNQSTNVDATKVEGDFDLVYIDPPYISGKGTQTDYRGFYHFLEGMLDYEHWEEQIDYNAKHRRLKRQPSVWTDKHRIHEGFAALFKRYADSILVVSYRSDGIPSVDEIVNLMRPIKSDIRIEHYGTYQYALSKNTTSKEVLIIGT